MGNMMNYAATFIDKFRSNLNLPINLNEKYTAKLYICENPYQITFQFNSMIFH